ncbi:MAG: FtsX-like permease family protein, partial [Methylococcaceae bacterium]|nr:FtsX-like permease family protein [Methylococcaceae bacterium]
MNRFNLALRLLWRDSRSGELTILTLALLIAVTSSTAIALFADRLQNTMIMQAAEFLAADLVITSPAEIPDAWQQKATQLKLAQARTVEFSSVLMEHDEMLLAAIKSVSSAYPLRGFLKTQTIEHGEEYEQHNGPAIGTVWIENRVLSALKLHVGDLLTVGEKPLTIAEILTYEPDKRGDFYSFSPRVLINEADLATTGILQAGSHVHYFFQFSGEATALAEFKSWIKPQLNPSQKLLDIHEDRPELGTAMQRRYTERHFNATALLRCMGCKQREILWLYSSQFVILGLLTSTIGCLLGWFAQQGLFYLLQDLLPKQLANPSISAVLFGLVLGLGVLLGFALPPLLRLKQVSPLRVLRRELEPLPTSGWLIYGLALGVITLLIARYTQDLRMTVTIIGVGVAALLVLGLLMNGLLVFMSKLLPSLPLVWRFGLQGLVKNSRASISQLLAFSITLVAMILSFNVRTDLIEDWQKSMPNNAPNHFVLNIFPEQLVSFKQALAEQKISGSQFYPVVRGRLVTINNIPVQQVVSKDSQGDNATHRELSLTWSELLPEDNKIIEGTWWTDAPAGLVSVEQKLAQSLKIKLNDELTFTIGSQQVNAKVASIRELQWNTMKPNFYMIFSPNTLNNYPYTFITSFYLPAEQKHSLNTLVKQYPSTTVLEVDLILQQIKTILTQLTQAINYLLYFALLAGFTVLLAAVYATLDARIYEGALMRTLGVNRVFLRKTHFIEFSVLGLMSGLLAVLISEAIRYALYTQVIHIGYQPSFYLWGFIPLTAALLVGLVGYWGL